ncbi:MAG: L-rhamnose mutarotase [Bacteroidia bacterium]|nr:L-rhamnose mutarotase [Bacteroidia bacterium]
MPSRKFSLCLDLKDNPELITQYKAYHAPGAIWPEIKESIYASGIESMEIFLSGNRLFMIMEVDEKFDFEEKSRLDAGNPKVQEWEELMWKFQQSLPWAKAGEKWILMEKIFDLSQQ